MKKGEIYLHYCAASNYEHSTRELSNPMLKRVSLSPAILKIDVGREPRTHTRKVTESRPVYPNAFILGGLLSGDHLV